MGDGKRFFIDHGTIHDLKTGRHVRTDPDFGPGRKFEEDGIEQCCDLLNSLESALAASKAREERLREALELAAGALHYPENGVHYCRGCNAGTHDGWKHGTGCSYMLRHEQVETAKAAINRALTTPPEAEK